MKQFVDRGNLDVVNCQPGEPEEIVAFARWRSACSSERMRWTSGGDSSDIEDRRGEGGSGSNFGGFNGMHLGIGGTLVLIVLSFLFRTNLFSVLGGGGTAAPSAAVRPLSNPDADPAEKREVEFVTFVINDVQHTWEQLLPQGRHALPAHQARALPRPHTIRLRHSANRDRTVLLPRGREGLHRPGILSGVARPVRSAGRVRAGLRAGPRSRSPRAETARHRGQDAPALARRSGAGESAFGPAGTAGGLLRGRVGPRHRTAQDHRRCGCRGRTARCSVGRRRPFAAHGDRARPPGELHAWQFGTADRVVPPWAAVWRYLDLRHFRCPVGGPSGFCISVEPEGRKIAHGVSRWEPTASAVGSPRRQPLGAHGVSRAEWRLANCSDGGYRESATGPLLSADLALTAARCRPHRRAP